MTVLKMLFLFWVSVIQVSWATAATVQEHEGVISSPNFPLNYEDGEDIQYSLVAPENHVISLKFINFEIEDVTDFIKILDGSDTLTIYGNVNTPTPFYFISKSNQLKVVIPSKYNDVTENEFKLVYKVHQVPPACTAENNHQNLFEQCESLDTINTQCIQGCKQNRTLVEYSKQSCVNEAYLPFTCIDEDVMKQCENTTFTDCPYNDEEIISYYETIDWSAEEERTEESKSEMHSVLKRSTSNCRRLFCNRKSGNLIPSSCKFFAKINKGLALRCVKCRKLSCNFGYFPEAKPPPATDLSASKVISLNEKTGNDGTAKPPPATNLSASKVISLNEKTGNDGTAV